MKLEFNQELAPDQVLSSALISKIENNINDLIKDVPEGVIAASFVTDQEIKRLNRQYRKKDQVTDVLSFSYDNQENLGDIVISLEQAKRQAEEGIEIEVADLLIHGILHVLGYDHENPNDSKIMFSLQDKILAQSI